MTNDAYINYLAHITGCSRKRIIETLKYMSNLPDVQEEIKKIKNKK